MVRLPGGSLGLRLSCLFRQFALDPGLLQHPGGDGLGLDGQSRDARVIRVERERIAALAQADEVLVSGTTHDSADGSGLRFEDHGVHELKGLSGQRQLWLLVEGQGVSAE